MLYTSKLFRKVIAIYGRGLWCCVNFTSRTKCSNTTREILKQATKLTLLNHATGESIKPGPGPTVQQPPFHNSSMGENRERGGRGREIGRGSEKQRNGDKKAEGTLIRKRKL